MSVTKKLGLTAIGAVVVGGALLGATRVSQAQSGGDYLPQATLVEVMDAMVMPLAQALWDSVSYEDTVKGPATEEGWQKARAAAVSLAEASNALVIPGRSVAPPSRPTGDGELSAKEIHDLIAQNRGAWVGHAHALHEVAMQAIAAIDAKNAEQLGDVGGTLDAVCEGCHKQFWYPNQ